MVGAMTGVVVYTLFGGLRQSLVGGLEWHGCLVIVVREWLCGWRQWSTFGLGLALGGVQEAGVGDLGVVGVELAAEEVAVVFAGGKAGGAGAGKVVEDGGVGGGEEVY